MIWNFCEHSKHTKTLVLLKLQIQNLNPCNGIFKTVYKDLVKSKDSRKWLVSIFWAIAWEIFSLMLLLDEKTYNMFV